MLDEYIASLKQLVQIMIETADKIEDSNDYREKLIGTVKEIEEGLNLLFQLFSDEEIAEAAAFDKIYILQILQDLMNAMENEDKVLLVDVLRFGLNIELQRTCMFLIEINDNLGEE